MIGGDSTNSNTGWKGGAFHFLEKYLDRRLFWCVCQLHTNELKLRRLISTIDGKTCSKDGWKGELRKMLKSVPSMERDYKFQAIPSKVDTAELNDKVVSDLSTDQHYGYRITKAITSGKMDEDLGCLAVGKTGHSRWLTTANLFCSFWCSKHCLKKKSKLLARLKMIVTFIVTHYFPCWFQIKIHHSWVDGPNNVLFELSCLRAQTKKVQDIVMPTTRSSA